MARKEALKKSKLQNFFSQKKQKRGTKERELTLNAGFLLGVNYVPENVSINMEELLYIINNYQGRFSVEFTHSFDVYGTGISGDQNARLKVRSNGLIEVDVRCHLIVMRLDEIAEIRKEDKMLWSNKWTVTYNDVKSREVKISWKW